MGSLIPATDQKLGALAAHFGMANVVIDSLQAPSTSTGTVPSILPRILLLSIRQDKNTDMLAPYRVMIPNGAYSCTQVSSNLRRSKITRLTIRRWKCLQWLERATGSGGG